MVIHLTLFVWISVVFSFPHTHPMRTAGPVSSLDKSPLLRQFAFAWFKDSPADKNDEEPDCSANSQLSENLADASNVMESFKTSKLIGERSGAALQELSYTFVEGKSTDGKVKVTFNGQQIPVGVEIDEIYLEGIVSENGKEGVDDLCSALTYAMKDAHYKSGVKVEEKMNSVYTDLEFDSE